MPSNTSSSDKESIIHEFLAAAEYRAKTRSDVLETWLQFLV